MSSLLFSWAGQFGVSHVWGAELNAKRAEAARNAALKKKLSGEDSVSSDGVTRERSFVVLILRCSKKKALDPSGPNARDESTQQIVPIAQTQFSTGESTALFALGMGSWLGGLAAEAIIWYC